MKTTFMNNAKSELMQAANDYYFLYDKYVLTHPHGVSFCYETMKSSDAGNAMRLATQETVYMALSRLFKAKYKAEKMEELERHFLSMYNDAATQEEMEEAEKGFFALYTAR